MSLASPKEFIVRLASRASLVLALVMGVSMLSVSAERPAGAETTQEAFIRSLVVPAQKNESATGIPASVAIGQAALETGWGRSSMSKAPINTLFNIKCTAYVSPYQVGCHTVRTAEYRPDGTAYYIYDKFRTYANTGDSVLDYGRLLTTASRYRPAFDHTENPDQFVREIARAGYATDPKYADLVIGIMKSYNLYQYDNGGAGYYWVDGKPAAGGSKAELWYPGPVPSQATVATLPQFVSGADYPAYAPGMNEFGVRTLQRLLNDRYSAGLTVDGIFGAGTDIAVRSVQNRAGQKTTGVMDDPSWKVLLPTLTAGSKGGSVTALQYELRQHGMSLSITGTYDAQTVAAVRAFQDKHKIRPDAKVGPVLWARLLDW